MLDVNAISLAARQLRSYLSSNLGIVETQIFIGHPKEGVEDAEDKTGKQFLNLFFYRIEHGAYPADATVADPFYVRLHCLITALGNKETSGSTTVSAGENDLRLIGAVMALMHQQPHVHINDDNGDEVAQLQVINHPLTLDDLNNIWSTQGDVPYHLSVGYEIALAPLPLSRPQETSPRVASIGAEVEQALDYAPLPDDGFVVTQQRSRVESFAVNGDRPDWVPHIAFVLADGSVHGTQTFHNSAIPAQLGVIAAGKVGSTVSVDWEMWDKENGWQAVTPSAGESLSVQTEVVNPASPDMSMVQNITLPISANGQALLYAHRSWTRADGSNVTLRSNPLLVTVYGEEGA